MAEDQRVGDVRIADAGFVEPVEIRSTDADGRDTNKLLVGSGYRISLLVKEELAGSMQA
jgi:hypothetical protein